MRRTRMKQFAVGDKVRRVNYAGLLEIGGVYTVSNVSIKGLIGVKEFTSEDGDKTPFDVTNFDLVSKSSGASEKSESDIVKAWFDKLNWLDRNTPIATFGGFLSNEIDEMNDLSDCIDFVINSYDAYQNKAKQKEKQELLDKKKALEVELAEINKQLGE
jgi:hypothetical protein